MSAEATPAAAGPFSARSVMALVLVGLVAFSGFVVLGVYAPQLRGRTDQGAHALSSSAIGYRGATLMVGEMGSSMQVGRARPDPRALQGSVLVLTPNPDTPAKELAKAGPALRTLIVLPKWQAAPDPVRPGFVRKAGFIGRGAWVETVLADYAPGSKLTREIGVLHPKLRGAGGVFASGTYLPLGRMDGLQTIEGPDWAPALADEHGRAVLAQSRSNPRIYVLADPDLLNNQGLAQLDNARAGMAILQSLQGEGGVVFDVTLNGFGANRSLLRLMLEPPWLAATLCCLAAAVLMGWQAAARFGAAQDRGRAVALGAAALVDNSAGLIRMGRKEAALAPDYVETTRRLVAQAAGDTAAEDGLARIAERRGLADPASFAAEAGAAKSRDDLMRLARRLYEWRLEMTRERG